MLILRATSFLLLLATSSGGLACVCDGPSLEKVLRAGGFVFVGRAVKGPASHEPYPKVYTFEVIRVFNGFLTSRVRVQTFGGAMCGATFEVSRLYAVVPHPLPASDRSRLRGPAASWSARLCSGTTTVSSLASVQAIGGPGQKPR